MATEEDALSAVEEKRHEENPMEEASSFDPQKLLSRSTSDALLVTGKVRALRKPIMAALSETDMSGNLPDHLEDLDTPLVSERNRVYFDLTDVAEGEGLDLDPELESTEAQPDLQAPVSLSDHEEGIFVGRQVGEGDQPLELTRVYDRKGGSTSSMLDDRNFYVASPGDVRSDSPGGSAVPSDENGQEEPFFTKYPLRFPSTLTHAKYKHNLKLSFKKLSQRLEQQIRHLQHGDLAWNVTCLYEMLSIVMEAWDQPVYGRDLAYGLCDIVRMEGLLDLLVKNCATSSLELLKASVCLLEQVMSIKNRERVAKIGLEQVVKMTKENIGNVELAGPATGILENMFKLSEETCTRVISLGGLDVLLHWCRSADTNVLRHCAKALANLSLFGGAENQQTMASQKVPEWLFPLAFSDDNSVRYYACLAVTALVANKELEACVIASGTLDLVLPFINTNQPSTFAISDLTHKQGRDKIWLKHLIPLLFSRRAEAQALAAFHFAMEASIKAEQGRQDIFYDIDAVEPLKKVASSPNAVASRLAMEALKVIGEKIPHKLSQQVPLWTCEDVCYWLSQVGFSAYEEKFRENEVDGDLLLTMNEEDLRDCICMTSSLARKRFWRELKSLKVTSDYSSCDPTGLDPLLMGILPDLSQYTYCMLRSGVDRYLLTRLTDDELRDECGITSSIHRRKILLHIDDGDTPSSSCQNVALADFSCSMPSGLTLKNIDVFICYRRSSGSQLASLLKVHLHLRGFRVFLDIDRLRAGKFDDNLLLSIRLSRHFVLVLTHDAMERVIGDNDRDDWVHKEIHCALEANVNIIPIMDSFDWPSVETLPMDIRAVTRFNGIKWVHDYQDACVDKLVAFLRGEAPQITKQTSSSGQGSSHSTPDVQAAPATPHTSSWSSGHSSAHSSGHSNLNTMG